MCPPPKPMYSLFYFYIFFLGKNKTVSVKTVSLAVQCFQASGLGVVRIKLWDYTSTFIVSSQTLEANAGGQ